MVRTQPDPPLINGGLAQLGEHLLCKQGVVGSIPSSSTIDFLVARVRESSAVLGPALVLGADSADVLPMHPGALAALFNNLEEVDAVGPK